MAAPSVHNKTGKRCALCGTEFKPSSLNLTISVRETGFIVKKSVCGPCHHDHISKGE